MNTTTTPRQFSYSKLKGTLGYLQTRTVRYSCPRLAHFLCWGKQVLDVGCGPGGITADVATAIYPAGKATGVDVTEDAIEAAREFAKHRHIENLDFHLADAYHLPFPDNSFDLTYAINTAIYLDNIQRALREWCRVTTPHGWIFLNVLDFAESRMYWPPCPSVTKFYQQQRKDPHASMVGAALDGVGDAGLVDIQVMVEAPPEFTFFTGSSGLDFVNILVKTELLTTEDPQLKQTAENALRELESWDTHPHHLAVEIHTWIVGRIPQ